MIVFYNVYIEATYNDINSSNLSHLGRNTCIDPFMVMGFEKVRVATNKVNPPKCRTISQANNVIPGCTHPFPGGFHGTPLLSPPLLLVVPLTDRWAQLSLMFL